jgi:hypothetical protein
VTIGTSLHLIALGAILKFAVTARVAGIDLQTAGVILMVVGAVGFLVSLYFAARSRSTGIPPPPDAP